MLNKCTQITSRVWELGFYDVSVSMVMAMAAVCMVQMGSTSIGDKGYLSTAQVGIPLPRRLGLGRFRVQASAAATAVTEEEPTAVAEKKPVQRLKAQYLEKVAPALTEEFKYTNMHQVPKLQKVIVNCGNGEAAQNAKILEGLQKDLSLITGQKPVVTRAKKAVAAFKLRKDVPVGVAVTLRGDVMYSFLDRLFNLAFPRTRDFQGVSPYSFDGKGNYNVGVKDHSVFPEIKFESIDKQRGFDVSICTTAPTDKEGQKLLTLLGLPFKEGAAKPVKRKGGQWTIKGAKRKVTKTKKK